MNVVSYIGGVGNMQFSLNGSKLSIFGLILGPLLFVVTLVFFHPEGLSDAANAVLASTLWIAVWWILEVIPIAVTSLLPVILFPLTGALPLADTTSSFGHKYVFLFLGGFIIAIAIERWNLHKRIALNIIQICGTNVKSIILGFMIATAFLSMWISNTATAVMMLPIGLAIIAQLSDNPKTEEDEHSTFGKALMLGIAYSASIGGLATLIGTPPNLVLAGIVEEMYNVEISFSQWMIFGLPISIIMLVICWKYLTSIAFSFPQQDFAKGRSEIRDQLRQLGTMSYEEKWVSFVFACTALAWITRSFFLNKLIPNIDDTIIAMTGAVLMFLIPASRAQGRMLINWKEAVKLPWGIILLFGGGLALAEGFKESGLAEWIGGQMTLLDGVSLFVLLLICVAMVNFLTEITSNIATIAMMLPVLAPLAIVLDVHPFILMIGATVAASCAFMLPVATPPNAIVFGSGYLKIPDMVRAGIWLNLISIVLITIITYFLLPVVWGIDPGVFPQQWLDQG